MKTFTLTIIAAFIFPNVNAQISFQKTLGGPNSDRGYSVQQTDDGGYIIAGTKEQGAGSPSDIYLIKTDANGNEVWSKTFGGANDDAANAVQQTSDGGYILVGETGSFGAVSFDIYLIKTDENGDTLWTKTFHKGNDAFGISIQQTDDGGYIITGFTDFSTSDNAYLIKTDTNGDTVWTKTFGGSDDDYGHSVQQTADGGYIIAGFSASFNANGDDDVYLIKTDANGNAAWSKTFGGTNEDDGYSVQQTNDGGYIIAGSTSSSGAGEFDVYLIRTDANGDTAWTKTFGGQSFDEGYFVRQTNDGGYVVTGYVSSDVYLIKTNADGNATWTKTFGGTGDDYGYCVQQTTDGGYIITGYTDAGPAGNNDVILIKTDSNGNIVTGIEEESPTAFSINIYPNPASESVTLDYSSINEKVYSISIINNLGEHIATYQPDSNKRLQLQTSTLPTGVFIIELATEGNVIQKTMVVQ